MRPLFILGAVSIPPLLLVTSLIQAFAYHNLGAAFGFAIILAGIELRAHLRAIGRLKDAVALVERAQGFALAVSMQNEALLQAYNRQSLRMADLMQAARRPEEAKRP